MTFPGASSGRSRVRGFSVSPSSDVSKRTTPTGVRRTPGWDGRGWDTEVVPFADKWQKELAWADEHLPDEHRGFVAVAIQTMKRSGTPVSTKSVLAHLVASGRDRKSTDALAAKYARKVAA